MPTSYVRLIEVFVDRFDNSRQKLKWARRTWSPTHQENGFFYLFFVRIVHLGNRVHGCFKNERNEKKNNTSYLALRGSRTINLK